MGGRGENTVVVLFRVMFRAEDTSALYALRSSIERTDPSVENQRNSWRQHNRDFRQVLWGYYQGLGKISKEPSLYILSFFHHAQQCLHMSSATARPQDITMPKGTGEASACTLWVSAWLSYLLLGLNYNSQGKVAPSHARYHLEK